MKGIVLIFLSLQLWIFAAMAADLQYDFPRYNYKIENQKVTERGVFAVPVPRFDDLVRDASRFQTYEQFLDYLFQQAPSLREHAVLVHHSESQQISSPEHPRVILFDGGMAFALSEHPMNRGQRVEIMDVDPVTYNIGLHEILFENGGPRFERSPPSCATCHGSPAKPLWAPYDFWPNAFAGSVGMMNSVQEAEAYQALLARKAQSPLLSRLMLPKKMEIGSEQNTAFTQYISMINFPRWSRQTLGSSSLRGFEHVLLAQLSLCGTTLWEDFAAQKKAVRNYFRPGEIDAYLPQLDQIYRDLDFSRKKMKAYQANLLGRFFPQPTFDFVMDHDRLIGEVPRTALFRWLLDLAGFRGSNLSTSLIANDEFFSTPSLNVLDLLSSLYEIRPDLFHDLNIQTQDVGTGRPGYLKLDCDELKRKSLLASRQFMASSQWLGPLSVKYDRPVLSRCAKCHVEGADPTAPPIPFFDSKLLAERIRNPADQLGDRILFRINTDGPGQMPPDQSLSEDEIQSLTHFIDTIR